MTESKPWAVLLTGPARRAHRVVYRIEEDTRTVYVLSIRLRGDVYGVR